MLIDFHTHVFPEKMAAATIGLLQKNGGIAAHTDGTASGLRASMKAAGIAYSVVLPIVTKPSQFDSINRFAAVLNGKDGLFSFGGIHPDNEDIEHKLDTIKQLGLKGIKLHPDYQGVFIDDERYIRIIRGAVARGLYVSIHAGIDIGLPDPVHCSPDRAARMLEAVGQNSADPHIILAHTGGWRCWDDVERRLIGKPVLFDISFSLSQISDDQLLRMIHNHGADKFLFATDSPWDDQAADAAYFAKLPLTENERALIGAGNAMRLLGL